MYIKILNWLSKKTDAWMKRLTKLKILLTYKIYMDKFGYRKSDIYIVTYPRSGTTLLQAMLYQITTGKDLDFDHIYDVSPWIKNDVYEFNEPNTDLNDPRIIKTHDSYDKFDSLVNGKVIYVIRDGLDAMYSLYQQKVAYGNPDLKLRDYVENTLSKDTDFNWFIFNGPWLQNKKNRDVLYLTYNELVKNKKETIKKISDFINVDYNSIDVEKIMNDTSIENMKKHQEKFGERVSSKHENYVYDQFIRKGQSGEGKDKFDQQFIDFYKMNYTNKILPLLKQRGLEEL